MEEKINWFGEPKKNKIKNNNSKHNSNSINYLGMGEQTKFNPLLKPFSFLGINANTKREKVNIKHKIPQNIDFLGNTNNKKYKMNPSFLFKKESIKSKKKLSKWGDADLDGSPNWLDCDPRNAFKDAKPLSSNYTKEEQEKILLNTRKKINERSLKAQNLKGAFNQLLRDKRIDRQIKKRQSLEKGIPFRKTIAESASTLKQKMRMAIPGLATDEDIIKQYESRPAFGKLGNKLITDIKETFSSGKGHPLIDKTQKKLKYDTIKLNEAQKKFTPLLELEIKKEKRYGDIINDVESKLENINIKLEDESISKDERDKLLKQKNVESEKYKNVLPFFKEAEAKKEEYATEIENIREKTYTGKKQSGIMSAAKEQSEKTIEQMNKPGMKGRLIKLQHSIDEKIIANKPVSSKELTKLAKLKRQISKIGDIQQEGKLSRELLTKVPGGEIGRVLSGAGITASGQYSDAIKAKSQKIRRMTEFASGAMFGNIAGRRSFDSEPRGRGRPPGPSGEYRIGEKPVYEAEFQQYASKQAALNRMLPSNQQSASLNPEYIAMMKAQKAEERGEMQTVMTEEGMPMEGAISETGNAGLPTTGTSMMQTGEQQIQLKERRAYNRATPDEIRQAQFQAQQMDNPLYAPTIMESDTNILAPVGPGILNAPNIMKGDMVVPQGTFVRQKLRATGGNLLTAVGPSILEAPKVFKGEMRNVTKSNMDEGEIRLGERPQTNSFGDEWLDVEISSGKAIIRKRITEKWMDGRAL